MPDPAGPLSPVAKVTLVAEVWLGCFRAWAALRRRPLPAVVAEISSRPPRPRAGHAPRRLARVVDRATLLGPLTPRCLYRALALFALVQRQGYAAHLVVGLPDSPKDKSAHAWVEVDGIDVGPSPGGRGHEALARFG